MMVKNKLFENEYFNQQSVFSYLKLALRFFVVILIMLLSIKAQAQTWRNPMTLSGEWNSYGIGDPFIMKFRGTYYLYCSTKDNNVGIKCWSSNDLITWSRAYDCSTDEITMSAYAPEVVYWNGTFYMYTSPGGNGHYVLTSNSPTGPFIATTSNLGKSIDGSVFINDDGNWYFFHAGNSSIMGCAMTNPTTIGSDVNLNARVGTSWTEGPCVIKRNGIYHLLYTGNHVISKGYRTDIAKNSTGPISRFEPQISQNPILIKTEGNVVGLGHGSAFIGPDLDSYYFCYHNLASTSGPVRHFNFDRIAWNGDKLLILGPTTWSQQAPKQPDMSDFFNRLNIGTNWIIPGGGNWSIQNQDYLAQKQTSIGADTLFKAIHTQPTTSNYTAEFNLKELQSESASSGFGAVFGYTDENNYGIAMFHSNNNKIAINFRLNGVWETPKYFSLPSGYNYSFWHTIRVEKMGTAYKFFIDGMLKSTLTSNLGAGKVGYITSHSQSGFGYIAFSNKVSGTGIFDVYKPIPGLIQAIHYNAGGDGVGYHDLSALNSGGKYIRNDSVDIGDYTDGSLAISDNQAGEWYKYNVNVKTTGIYNLGLHYASAVNTGQIRIWQGDTDLTGVINLPETGSATSWNTYTIKGLNLIGGQQNIKMEIVTGGFDFYEMNFVEADNTETTISDSFDSEFAKEWNYIDGNWVIESGEASISGYGKRTIGNTGWTDYTIQTDITYYNVFNGGLIFRVNNPALGGAGNNSILGIDFYQGYFISLSANSVLLGKQNYNWTQLASTVGTYVINKKYTLKVVVSGANIKVFVDDMITPKINYTDSNPFINGKVGLRAFNAHVHFDNFSITTNTDNQTKVEYLTSDENVELFPNPVSDKLTIRGISNFSNVSIYNTQGQKVYETEILGDVCFINTLAFNKGLCMLKLRNKSGNYVTRKFMKY